MTKDGYVNGKAVSLVIKGKRRTAVTITLMTIFAVIILITYYYWSYRTQPLSSTEEKLTEIGKLVNKDLELYYPGTPKETVKLFAAMMKALYDNPKDKDREQLALKIRELYDQEFLDNNPKDTYLAKLDADLEEWETKGRKITNYLLIEEEQDKESEIDGVKYAAQYISFTIQENSKYTEIWNVLLRQDSDGHWKILGWEPISEEEDTPS